MVTLFNCAYNKAIHISYDRLKSARNYHARGIAFDEAAGFDFSTALVRIDGRRDYGEDRYIAVGFIGPRLHVLVFTETRSGIRIISLRKANVREVQHYEERVQ